MVAGWTVAAWHPAALLVAQLLSGTCMSALEGDMDARVATGLASPALTVGLAHDMTPGNASPHDVRPGNASSHDVRAGNTLPYDVRAGNASSRPLALARDSSHGVTAGLASAAALRAFGSAAAVALAPRVIAEAGITGLSVVLATVLLGGMVITVAWHRSQSALPGTGPAAHPG